MSKDIELLQMNAKVIDSASNTIFGIAEKMFNSKYKDKLTTELKVLTNIGAACSSIKMCYDKLSEQIELLKELQEDDNKEGGANA